jgi:hypothetical protein
MGLVGADTEHPWPIYIRLFSPVAIQIFGRHIVFGHFMRANFLFISVSGTFHAGYQAGLKRVPFLEQLIDALGRGTFYVG